MQTQTNHSQPQTHRIYVASLSDYAAGIHHGVWIDAAIPLRDMLGIVDTMLETSPTARMEGIPAEEYAIHDQVGFYGHTLPEHMSLADVHRLASLLDCLTPSKAEAFAEYCDHNYGEAITDLAETFDQMYIGQFDDETSFGEWFAEETGLLEGVAPSVSLYFDYAAYGRDLLINHYYMTAGGHVFNI